MIRVLVFLLSPGWTGISRLPKALADAGFDVATLSTADSFLAQTRYARRHAFMAPGTLARDGLVNTLAAAPADLIIPGCDTAVAFMQRWALDVRSTADGGVPPAVRALLRRSLGDPAHYHVTQSKHETIAVARRAGIRAPAQVPVITATDAQRFAQQYGYPVVLKSEFGSGGRGVRICADATRIGPALHALAARAPGVPPPRIFAQQCIAGQLAMGAVTAMDSVVLERLCARKNECHPAPTGPSSVIEFIEHPAMSRAMATLVQQLGFNGFGSGDFIIDEAGEAWLIEFNPRPTPICHLGAAAGHDLARALRCRLDGVPCQPILPAQPLRRVALFPQEIIRDANSHWLTDAYHDVPRDDPALLASLSAHARRASPVPR